MRSEEEMYLGPSGVAAVYRAQSNGEDIVIGPLLKYNKDGILAWASFVCLGGRWNNDPHMHGIWFGFDFATDLPVNAAEVDEEKAECMRRDLVDACQKAFRRVHHKFRSELGAVDCARRLWPGPVFEQANIKMYAKAGQG
jgi:hypothetical protein